MGHIPCFASTLQMNWLASFAKQGISRQRAVDLMLVTVILTHSWKDPPSGSLFGRLLSEFNLGTKKIVFLHIYIDI